MSYTKNLKVRKIKNLACAAVSTANHQDRLEVESAVHGRSDWMLQNDTAIPPLSALNYL